MCLYLTLSNIKNYYTGVSVTYCCVTSRPPNLVAKNIIYIHGSLICVVFSWEVLLLVLSGVTHLADFWGLLLAGIAGSFSHKFSSRIIWTSSHGLVILRVWGEQV